MARVSSDLAGPQLKPSALRPPNGLCLSYLDATRRFEPWPSLAYILPARNAWALSSMKLREALA